MPEEISIKERVKIFEALPDYNPNRYNEFKLMLDAVAEVRILACRCSEIGNAGKPYAGHTLATYAATILSEENWSSFKALLEEKKVYLTWRNANDDTAEEIITRKKEKEKDLETKARSQSLLNSQRPLPPIPYQNSISQGQGGIEKTVKGILEEGSRRNSLSATHPLINKGRVI